MDEQAKKNLTKVLLVAGVLVLAVVLYLLLRGGKKTVEKGTVESAKEVGETVPEITTNPGAEVPEVNPLDRANPFKYQNPLR